MVGDIFLFLIDKNILHIDELYNIRFYKRYWISLSIKNKKCIPNLLIIIIIKEIPILMFDFYFSRLLLNTHSKFKN